VSDSQVDRRSAPRFSMQLPVRVRFSNARPHEETASTRDISNRGVYLYMNVNPGEAKAIELILTLPPPHLLAPPIEVRYQGEVIRVELLSDRDFGVAARTAFQEFLP
jgi:hypothetical protein